MKKLIGLLECSDKEICEILNCADQFKFEKQNKINHRRYEGMTLGIAPDCASGISVLAAQTAAGDFGLGSVALPKELFGGDTGAAADLISGFVDCALISSETVDGVEAVAKAAAVPVVNLGTVDSDPCGALAALMCVRELRGLMRDLKVCCVSPDGSKLNSMIAGCAAMGMKVSAACPGDSLPDSGCVKKAGAVLHTSFEEAAANADVIFCAPADVGVQNKGTRPAECLRVTADAMRRADPNAIVLHSEPAHRAGGIDEEVYFAHREESLEFAKNRLHVLKALISKLI